ncbi:MAG: enoyl-CoA hydratase-related protein [Alphaproteobacteria bacterium]|nr:enoyl-CoA hydratase-related protein [Alphaproteobacteria bacterium]
MKSQRTFADGALTASTLDNKGYLAINRPDRKNALNQRMWREIPLALDWLSGHADIRCIVIRGAGDRDFSAGADITEFETVRQDPETAREYEFSNAAAFRAIRLCPIPVIAMIRGICFGGAFGLAAAADIRLASNDAVFSIPAGRLGLAYPVDAIDDIIQAAGLQLARTLLFTGKRMTAKEALAGGLVLSTCHGSDLIAHTESLADEMCSNAPLSNRASKAAIRAALSGNSQDRLVALELAEGTFTSADYSEGRAAFAEKRPPRFTGA